MLRNLEPERNRPVMPGVSTGCEVFQDFRMDVWESESPRVPYIDAPTSGPDVWGLTRRRPERDAPGHDEQPVRTDTKTAAIRRVKPRELGPPPNYPRRIS